ncbi:hypothetical protein [Zoogloea sp.]|uniref:hypothetical protein n=1 Tax=Zoogloea sp. TaxID=49181 RepID=UPI0035B2075D
MPSPNVKLKLQFELDLTVPEILGKLDHAQLCKALGNALGPMVIQGLPTISAKQLGKVGVQMCGHHHKLDALNLSTPPVEASQIIAVAPHLTDEEVQQVARKASGKMPLNPAEGAAFLRRQALGVVNEYRLVRCVAHGVQINGHPVEIEADLNLTNGHLFLPEIHRQTRLANVDTPLKVDIVGQPELQFRADCSGHTLTGPVLDVQVASLAPHRDVLLQCWKDR